MDLTAGCLDDLSKKAARKVPELELRQTFCQACRNRSCDYANLANLEWEERMSTQVDRMFGGKRVTASPDDPRWAHMRAIDFPSLLREAIRLEVADRRGDWTVPDEEEGLDMLVGRLPMDEESDEDRQIVDDAVAALRKEWGDGSGPSHDEETDGEAPNTEPEPEPEPEPEFEEEPLDEDEVDEESDYRVVEVESKTQKGMTYEVSVDDNGKAVSCTCKAGKYGRKCKHLAWAEEIFARQAQYQDQVRDLGDPFFAPAVPRPTQPQIRQAPPQALQQAPHPPAPPPKPQQQSPHPRLQNVPTQPGGQMVDDGPARSLLPQGDPWSPKNAVRKVESGVRITVGKKDD